MTVTDSRVRKRKRSLWRPLGSSRVRRGIALGAIAMVAGGIAIVLSYSIIEVTPDYTAKATIFGAAATVLGIIFSAIYNEMSSYYKERSANIEKKWNLIYPLATRHYYPWINVAIGLQYVLKETMPPHVVDDYDSKRLLFMIMLFFGYRLRFIVEAGGLILLSTPAEGKHVWDAYREIEKHMKWDGENTSESISYLQYKFLSKEKSKIPYVQSNFLEDLGHDRKLGRMNNHLAKWLRNSKNGEDLKALHAAVKEFNSRFGAGIDKIYSAWQT